MVFWGRRPFMIVLPFFVDRFLLKGHKSSFKQVKNMSYPQFFPVNPNRYKVVPQVSGTRQEKGHKDVSFEQRFEAMKTRMDLEMANVLFENGSGENGFGEKNQGGDMSLALNADVLTTLSKLSGQGGSALGVSGQAVLGQLLSGLQGGSGLYPALLAPSLPPGQTEVNRLGEEIEAENGPVATRGKKEETSDALAGISSETGPAGKLSRHFESGGACDAIGYDRHGGTSYGTYQISSRQGTMNEFIEFLRQEIPVWAKRLEKAGPADTGSTQGKMPSVWRAIAAEEPDLFAQLQHRFVRKTHYQPALKHILQATGLGEKVFSPALQEVLFSTAVQHGATGAGDIFTRAWENLDLENVDLASLPEKLMDEVYALRKKRFSSSTERVQSSVANRLNEEWLMAQNLLDSMTA